MVESRIEKNQDMTNNILDEERKRKNKLILKILLWIFTPIFILFSISYFLLTYVGNKGIIVKETAITSEMLPYSFNGLKIVQFSDIHYNSYSSISKIENLVEMINNTNPDIIIFTGDLVDSNYTISDDDISSLINLFKSLNTSIGKYAIYGEEDNDLFKNIFNNSDFTILDNELINIYNGNDIIQLLAFNSNTDNITIQNVDQNYFSIALIHKPDFSDDIINNYSPNLILAGHSHNGQVVLPFIGPLMRKEGSKKYIDDYYKVNDTHIYISSGIGNTKYNFRLFNKPSFNFFRLRTNNVSQ